MVLDFDSDAWDESLTPQLRASQIIVAALALGALSFLVITVFMAPTISGEAVAQPAEGKPVILYMGLALTCLALAARSVIPNMLDAVGRRSLGKDKSAHHGGSADRSDLDGKLMALYQRRLIVAAALIEGPTFLLILAYMLEQRLPALVMSLVMIVLIAAHCPTRQRVSNWLVKQRRLIAEQVAFGNE